jgi:hypothetical protein
MMLFVRINLVEVDEGIADTSPNGRAGKSISQIHCVQRKGQRQLLLNGCDLDKPVVEGLPDCAAYSNIKDAILQLAHNLRPYG